MESLDDWSNRAFDAALSGETPRWDAVVRSLGLSPLTDEHRAALRGHGAPKLKGVVPVELRVVLEAIRLRFAAGPDAASLRDELDVFVDREMVRFIAAAQPPKAALAGIFANAQRTALRTATGDAVSALKCGCCGAARPEGTDLRTCAFCGAALFASKLEAGQTP